VFGNPAKRRRNGSEAEAPVPRQEELGQILALGIHPASLAGRLRLVLTVGCYGDFRFTRDILSTSAARDQLDPAIQALRELGANCDCEVFHAVGQPPLGILWHRPVQPPVG
jgi:hypothetical protein